MKTKPKNPKPSREELLEALFEKAKEESSSKWKQYKVLLKEINMEIAMLISEAQASVLAKLVEVDDAYSDSIRITLPKTKPFQKLIERKKEILSQRPNYFNNTYEKAQIRKRLQGRLRGNPFLSDSSASENLKLVLDAIGYETPKRGRLHL